MKTSSQSEWDMNELLSIRGKLNTVAASIYKQEADTLVTRLKHIDPCAVVMCDFFVNVDVNDIPVVVNTHDKIVTCMINEERKDFGYESTEGVIKFIENINEVGAVVEAELNDDMVKEIAAFLDGVEVQYNIVGTSIIFNVMGRRDNIIVIDTHFKTHGSVDASDSSDKLSLDHSFDDWREIPEIKRLRFHIV